ncbi:hypothetical protein BJ138DRAFT_1118555 [Hygrophoropsis aurantiaca]|uniref:Uncharacterized protein n=1 Tax=Hygrophoropsis aurantiaca TaxID=72124 RepID=A0ACB7ZWT2_9AGAM|nr:hypothetical protein BJ138DRAFT_1118555 [Hygrophoropsis aurantiaca]
MSSSGSGSDSGCFAPASSTGQASGATTSAIPPALHRLSNRDALKQLSQREKEVKRMVADVRNTSGKDLGTGTFQVAVVLADVLEDIRSMRTVGPEVAVPAYLRSAIHRVLGALNRSLFPKWEKIHAGDRRTVAQKQWEDRWLPVGSESRPANDGLESESEEDDANSCDEDRAPTAAPLYADEDPKPPCKYCRDFDLPRCEVTSGFSNRACEACRNAKRKCSLVRRKAASDAIPSAAATRSPTPKRAREQAGSASGPALGAGTPAEVVEPATLNTKRPRGPSKTPLRQTQGSRCVGIPVTKAKDDAFPAWPAPPPTPSGPGPSPPQAPAGIQASAAVAALPRVVETMGVQAAPPVVDGTAYDVTELRERCDALEVKVKFVAEVSRANLGRLSAMESRMEGLEGMVESVQRYFNTQ